MQHKSAFSAGHLYCSDCGAILHYCAAKSLPPEKEFYRCSNYKDGRGTCKVQYIRNVVLEKTVSEAISDFVDFVRCYEPVFLYMLAKKNDSVRQAEHQRLQQFVRNGEKEIQAMMDEVKKNPQKYRYVA